MSLFDEFDRLTPDPDKDKRGERGSRDPGDPRNQTNTTEPVRLRDPLASRIPPERRTEPSIAPGPMAPPVGAPDTPFTRPVDSIRFSLSRGTVAAIIAGSVVASALLYGGGYLTAYLVYQPTGGSVEAKNHPEPPPLVDADRPRSKAGEAGAPQKDSGPLKVVMSPETSGGQAVVAPQGEVTKTPPRAAPPVPKAPTAPKVETPAIAAAPSEPVAPVAPPPPVAAPTKPVKTVAAPSAPEKLLAPPVALPAGAPLPPAPGGLSMDAPAPPPTIAGPGTITPLSAPVKAPEKSASVATPSPKPEKPTAIAKADPAARSPVFAYTGSVGYTVQLGAFSSEANAGRMQRQLGDGIPGLRVKKGVTPSGRTLYYLRAGYYAKRGEANELAERLKAAKKIKAGYVMRVKAPAVTP